MKSGGPVGHYDWPGKHAREGHAFWQCEAPAALEERRLAAAALGERAAHSRFYALQPAPRFPYRLACAVQDAAIVGDVCRNLQGKLALIVERQDPADA